MTFYIFINLYFSNKILGWFVRYSEALEVLSVIEYFSKILTIINRLDSFWLNPSPIHILGREGIDFGSEAANFNRWWGEVIARETRSVGDAAEIHRIVF